MTKQTCSASLKQLDEMNNKAKRLVELMKKGIVYFLFKKKSTGEMRKAHGTLKRDLIPPEAQRKRGRPRKRPDDLVIYYDTDKKAIRSFKDYLLSKVLKDKAPASKPKEEDKEISKEKDNQHSSESKKQHKRQDMKK